MKLLRVLRVLSFIGLILVFILVIAFNVPFLNMLTVAISPQSATDIFFSIIIGCFVAYPILFFLTIVVLKIKGWHVYLLHGVGELSLYELFIQNEWLVFWGWLTATRMMFAPRRRMKFPYSVDFGAVNTKHISYNTWNVLAKLYRFIHTIIFVGLILVLFYIVAWYFSGRI